MHTCISSHGLKRSWRSCPRRMNAGNKNTPSTHHPWRRNVTTLMVGLKTVTYAKISPKSGEPQRYSWGTQKKKKKEKNFSSCGEFSRWIDCRSAVFAKSKKTMQNGAGEVAEVSYYCYSRDSCEIVRKFPCMVVAKFTNRNWRLGTFCLQPRTEVFRRCALQRVNFLVAVVNISNSKTPSCKDWTENGWILVWTSKCKQFFLLQM